MKRSTFFLILNLVAFIAVASPSAVQGEGVGTITQGGVNNTAYIYQAEVSEVGLIQLGDENNASVRQFGPNHLATVAQVGKDNHARVLQDGQHGTVFSIQRGENNDAGITQMKVAVWGKNTESGATTNQVGLNNTAHLLQLGDNTSSFHQIHHNNEVLLVQSRLAIGSGENFFLVLQFGISNCVLGVQVGSQLLARSLQVGNDNIANILQAGADNRTSVYQSGNSNTATINQSQWQHTVERGVAL